MTGSSAAGEKPMRTRMRMRARLTVAAAMLLAAPALAAPAPRPAADTSTATAAPAAPERAGRGAGGAGGERGTAVFDATRADAVAVLSAIAVAVVPAVARRPSPSPQAGGPGGLRDPAPRPVAELRVQNRYASNADALQLFAGVDYFERRDYYISPGVHRRRHVLPRRVAGRRDAGLALLQQPEPVGRGGGARLRALARQPARRPGCSWAGCATRSASGR